MKIAVLGVGSYVFGPSVLHDAIIEHRFQGMHLALYDPNRPAMELMAGVGRQMAKEANLSVSITCHDTRIDAIAGADFVVSVAAVQVLKRFAMDCQIISEHYPEHLVTEFGGVAGISYTLRQLPLIRGLAQDMLQHCPGAYLLTSSNPLPRLCQAMHEEGIKAAGFCSNSAGVYHDIGRMMMGIAEHFPWSQASAAYELEMAGVNHFTWLTKLTRRSTGEDITRQFMDRIRAGECGIAAARPLSMDLMNACGLFPPNGDTHMHDFVRPVGHTQSQQSGSHGDPAEREARAKLLEQVAAGQASSDLLLDHRAWEKPMDFVAAINGADAYFTSLNLINDGQLPQLPRNVFVETPAAGKAGRIIPTQQTLTPQAAEMCNSTAKIHSMLVQAERSRSRKLLTEVVELDPTILDKQRGVSALKACMEAHADLMGAW